MTVDGCHNCRFVPPAIKKEVAQAKADSDLSFLIVTIVIRIHKARVILCGKVEWCGGINSLKCITCCVNPN